MQTNLIKPYPWQSECLEAWQKNNFRGIVRVVTGAGKTILAVLGIERLMRLQPDLKVKVVVPSIPLAGQWEKELLRFGREAADRADFSSSAELLPGLYGADRRDSNDRRMMIYIINSARNVLASHIRIDISKGYHVLLICDECHHYASPENRKIFSFLSTMNARSDSQYHCLGLSATPSDTRSDTLLQDALGKEIYSYGFLTALDEGLISPFAIGRIGVSFSSAELAAYRRLSEKIRLAEAKMFSAYPALKDLAPSGRRFMKAVSRLAAEAGMHPDDPAAAFLLLSYTRKDVCILAQSRIRCCEALISALPADARILIFCEHIAQAETLYRVLERTCGRLCGLYHSGMIRPARERLLRSFRDRSVRILISCRCLDEGLDVPDADIGIVVSSSSAPRQRIQRLGRILRRSDDKGMATLYYLYIRESNDDSIYLPSLSASAAFHLRYDTAEKSFRHPVYEYAAMELLADTEKKYQQDERKISELRRCLLEGLVRSDFLLNDAEISARAEAAARQHSRNYWLVMRKMHQKMQVAPANSLSDP